MGNDSVQYNWHFAGFLGWPFAVLKYKYIFFSNKTYGSNSSNGTRKLVWFEITKVLIAV